MAKDKAEKPQTTEPPVQTESRKETAIKTVEMKDEARRLVDFAGKRKMLKESFIDQTGKVSVRLDFVNGETRTFTIPPEMLPKFAAHGAEQKLGDEIAGENDVEDCVLAVEALIQRLEKGEWNTKKEDRSMSGTSILLRALVEFSKKPLDEMKKSLQTKSHAEKIALRNNPRIKPIVERLEAEKAAKVTQVDSDILLDGILN